MTLAKAKIVCNNLTDAFNSINLYDVKDKQSIIRKITLCNLITALSLYIKEGSEPLDYMNIELEGIKTQLTFLSVLRNKGFMDKEYEKTEKNLLKKKEDLELSMKDKEDEIILNIPDNLLSKITSWY